MREGAPESLDFFLRPFPTPFPLSFPASWRYPGVKLEEVEGRQGLSQRKKAEGRMLPVGGQRAHRGKEVFAVCQNSVLSLAAARPGMRETVAVTESADIREEPHLV